MTHLQKSGKIKMIEKDSKSSESFSQFSVRKGVNLEICSESTGTKIGLYSNEGVASASSTGKTYEMIAVREKLRIPQLKSCLTFLLP